MKDILSEIIAHKQTEIELQKQTVSLEQLQEQAGVIIRENAAHRRSMKQALAASSTGIISEFKRRSPSKGWINEAARAEEIPASYEAQAHELGLEVLLEIHSPSELSYINKEVDMVGVNNRNLGSFVTDVENSFRIARQLREATHGPASPLLVSESGISDPETICRLRAAGFRGFLIGETFMKTANPGETLKKFIQDSLLINN